MYTIDKGFLSIFEWFTCHWDFLSHFKTSHYNQPFHLLIQVLSYPWLHFLALSINWTFPLCKLAINFNMIVVLFHGKHKTLLMFFVSILWHISHSLPLSTPPSHSLSLYPSLSLSSRSHSLSLLSLTNTRRGEVTFFHCLVFTYVFLISNTVAKWISDYSRTC